MRSLIAACARAAVLVAAPSAAAHAEPTTLDKLIKAYPAFLARHDQGRLIWQDGTVMAVSDGRPDKSFDERLRSASIADQLSLPYPKGPLAAPPAPGDDPGRFRNTAFFDKIYGDCTKNQTQSKLVTVKWLGGQELRITAVNGVARHLQEVSEELERMPQYKRYLVPSAGTFNCRSVFDTGARSMHAWGAAIDLNVAFADYWVWAKGRPYTNRIPFTIVEVFERHGFIWGGKWSHFDTMHFEYRPELLE